MPTPRRPQKKTKTAAGAKKPPATTAKNKSGASNKTAAPAKNKPAAPSQPAEDTATTHGLQSAFEHYLPLARALLAAEVKPLRFDPELAYFNLRIGVQAVLPHRETLELDLRRLDLDQLFDLPALGQALLFATSQAASALPAGPNLKQLLREGNKLRGQIMTAADTLVSYELVPATTVAKIRQGHGSLDAARDLGDLAALFAKYRTAFQKNTPVTAAQAKRAAELGAELIARLSPGSARKGRRAQPPLESVSDRDRLATLLVRGHRDLRRVGYWIWAEDLDAHVPALQSRARTRKEPAPLPPAPPPSPAA